MYGLVNRAVQDLVVTRFGADAWEHVKRRAGVEVDAFLSMRRYPDAMTYELVAAASAETGLAADEILERLGEHWIANSARAGYGELMTMFGRSLPEFLANLDNMHARLALTFPQMTPPSFRCSPRIGDTMTVRYYSSRAGLAPFVRGLLTGLGDLYGTPVGVTLQAPRLAADDADVFLVEFLPAS